MDGENNGKPYEQMDDLGGKPTIFGNTHIYTPLKFNMVHLKINPWKFGDSELGNHYFQVPC